MPDFNNLISNDDGIVVTTEKNYSIKCSNYTQDDIRSATKDVVIFGYSQVTNVQDRTESDDEDESPFNLQLQMTDRMRKTRL